MEISSFNASSQNSGNLSAHSQTFQGDIIPIGTAVPPEGIRRYLKPAVTRDPPTQRGEPPGTFSDVRLRWTVVSRVTSTFESLRLLK
ncbi:hypothetical protein CEXT_656311 [Caerostris extrusa]|uniref:Uncharacterized protein n=1 Tax=Caerostris extrusa TaxID=172846 RepID=A0AAV4U135_CAEEX|nr:hypothetical protein CEXT_656311 [Caerostris extrusa]